MICGVYEKSRIDRFINSQLIHSNELHQELVNFKDSTSKRNIQFFQTKCHKFQKHYNGGCMSKIEEEWWNKYLTFLQEQTIEADAHLTNYIDRLKANIWDKAQNHLQQLQIEICAEERLNFLLDNKLILYSDATIGDFTKLILNKLNQDKRMLTSKLSKVERELNDKFEEIKSLQNFKMDFIDFVNLKKKGTRK